MKRIAELRAILQKQNMKYESILDTILTSSQNSMLLNEKLKKLTKNI